ncbi:hypothetical protein KZX47_12215 [Thermus sp. SYSU G05001]|uniref:Phytase-like domain-containing protein n=1 Tax=Thermus brevis TaxID=2862456 RepID=A0ABS7A0R6_9DEIN|nr:MULTISPECIES: hypothetical protein [Thermus]MBW6395908.1 hypothetical protein [Thermus brevis]
MIAILHLQLRIPSQHLTPPPGPELDKVGTDFGALGIRLPQRNLVLETWKLPEFDTNKLEGLTLLEDGRTLAIADDNDFAITGKEGPSRLWLVLLPQALR